MKKPLYPRCEACPTRMERTQREYVHHENYPHFDDETALERAFSGRQMGEKVRHAMSDSDVMALYQTPTRISCSMAGGHPHSEGLVVKAKCGSVLFLGMKCGADGVEGFAAIKAGVKRTRDYHTQLAVVSQLPDLARRLQALEAELLPAFELVREVRTDFDHVARALAELARSPRMHEVDLPPDKKGGKPTRERMVGMQLWTGKYREDHLKETIQRCRRAKEKASTRLGAKQAKALSKEYGEIDQIYIDYERFWGAVVAPFFDPRNLLRVGYATRVPDPGQVALSLHQRYTRTARVRDRARGS